MPDAKQIAAKLYDWTEMYMHLSMHNFFSYIKEHNLSMSQMGALFHIYKKRAHGVSEIGDKLGVTSAAASQMMERLVQQGFVQRSESPDDRRLRHIVLTRKGQEIINQAIRSRQGWLEELMGSFSDQELLEIERAFEIINLKVKEMEQSEHHCE